MDEQQGLGEQLLRVGAEQGLKKAAGWIGGGALGLILLFIVVMAAIATFLGGGLGGGQGPPIGTSQARPTLWLTYPALQQSGLPNVLVLSVMAHESGGRIFATDYNCSGGVPSTQPCSRAYPGSRTLSEDAGLMQINSGGWPVPQNARKWQSLGIAQDPFDPARNLQSGIAELAADVHRTGYLEPALEDYNSGRAQGDAAYAQAVRRYLTAYEAGPTIAVWSTAEYTHGQWQVQAHERVWVVVAAAGPYGARFLLPWAPGPPKCTTETVQGKSTTVCKPGPPQLLKGRALVPPASVTLNGRAIASSAPNAPLWPGEQAFSAEVTGPGPYTVVATWRGTPTDTATADIVLKEAIQ